MLINSCSVFAPNFPVFGVNSKKELSLNEISNLVDLYKYYDSTTDLSILDSVDRNRFNGIGLYNTSDIEFDLQYHVYRMNSVKSDTGYIVDFNFEHSLDLILYRFYGVPIEKTRSIKDYEMVSSAIMTLTIENIKDVSLDVLSDLSSNLNSFLLSCRDKSEGSARLMVIYFLQGIHKNKRDLFKSIASKVCEVTGSQALYSGLSGFMLSNFDYESPVIDTVYKDSYGVDYKLDIERREPYVNR